MRPMAAADHVVQVRGGGGGCVVVSTARFPCERGGLTRTRHDEGHKGEARGEGRRCDGRAGTTFHPPPPRFDASATPVPIVDTCRDSVCDHTRPQSHTVARGGGRGGGGWRGCS